MSYKPKRLAALTTIDLQDLGLGTVQVNVFAFLQRLALLCLVLWCFCLKASNKFKSFQWLNYTLTFLLPNLLGGMLFMFLSKQFYLSTACSLDSSGKTVMIANPEIHCWRGTHLTYALRGMFGMSLFVPLAVLAFGSYQVFFPELKLDVQTSPLLNVSSQIVKAAMTGALTFFVDRVQLFLGVALVGNMLLLVLVLRNPLACSTWHLKYAKVFSYSLSSWSALCAMISTLVPASKKNSLPLYLMHAGWLVQTLLLALAVRWKVRKRRNAIASKPLGATLTRQRTGRLSAPSKH